MSACFNAKGNRLLCLELKESPVIYDLYKLETDDGKIPLVADGYRNDGTAKTACFAGEDDELAVAGSNDHKVHIWSVSGTTNRNRVTVNEPLLTLYGHRSIANHVRYNSHYCVLASCGVEKMIKLWSPFALPDSIGGLDDECAAAARSRASREPYKNLIGLSSNPHSTDEDHKMLAFIDLMDSTAALRNAAGSPEEDGSIQQGSQSYIYEQLFDFMASRAIAALADGDGGESSFEDESSNSSSDDSEDENMIGLFMAFVDNLENNQ